jgi:DUF1707 SHOCT-like domain
MVGPGGEIAAGEGGQDCLRASHADQEQVIDTLKAAFLQGRLTKDEFEARVSKVLHTYAELDALTADIPAGPTEAHSPEPARESHNRKVIQRGTAVGAGFGMAFTAAAVAMAGGSLAVGLIAVPVVGAVMAVLLAGLLTLLSWALEKGSSRQPPPNADGEAAGLSAPAGQLRQIRHDPRHTAEAAQSRLLHLTSKDQARNARGEPRQTDMVPTGKAGQVRRTRAVVVGTT